MLLGYVTCILDDAKVYTTHAKKKIIDLDDVKLASQLVLDKAFTSPPPRDVCSKKFNDGAHHEHPKVKYNLSRLLGSA